MKMKGYILCEYDYRDTTIIIKVWPYKKAKASCVFNGKVIFKEIWNFISIGSLLDNMMKKVDKWDSGEWIPKKMCHLLEYSILSNKVSWCDKCEAHFYKEENKTETKKSGIFHFNPQF